MILLGSPACRNLVSDLDAFLHFRCRDWLKHVKLATLACLNACLAAPKRVLHGTTVSKVAESNIFLVPIDLEATILQSPTIAGHDSKGVARVNGEARVINEADTSIAISWPRPTL